MKKENNYFIALMEDGDTLYTSWKVGNAKWKNRLMTAEKNAKRGPCLFIEIYSIENNKLTKLDAIPVHGIENKWHIFIHNKYCGKRIILTLSYLDRAGNSIEILRSSEIDIPIHKYQADKGKALYELSGIDLKEPGSENTSW